MKLRLLAAGLLICMLASCAGPVAPDDDTAAPVSDDTAVTETTTAAETEPPFVSADMNGKEFIILARGVEGSMPCEADSEETGDVLGDALYKRNLATEEALKVKITAKSVVRGDMPKLVQNMIQTGVEEFDVGLVNYNTVPNVIGTSGALVSLDSIQTLDLDADWWDSASLEAFRLHNKHYFAVGNLNLNSTLAIYGLIFNQKLISDNQLTSPYELVTSGKWTMDTMHTMMQKVQKDLNGDSVMDDNDQYGLIYTPNGFKYMFYHAGEELVRNGADGKLTVNKTQRLYDVVDDILPVTNMGYQAGGGSAAALQAFFQTDKALFYQSGLQSTLELRNMQSDYGIIPGPKADDKQENYCSPLAGSYVSVTMVPNWNKDTDDIGILLNAMGYYSKQYVTSAVADFLLPAKLARDENSLKMLEIMDSTKLYAINAAFNFGKTEGILNRIRTAQTNTMASEIASLESAANAAIAELLANQE